MKKTKEIKTMNPTGNTKQKILDIAESLLGKRGFNGFSYKHISSLLGIKNAAVHYYYPTKSDLGVELTLRARNRLENWTTDIESKDLDPSQKMEAFFDFYEDFLESEDRTLFTSALEANFNILPEEMQQEARMLVFSYLSWLEKVLRQGREEGLFSFEGTALEQAHMIWAIMNGTMYLAQIIDRTCLDTTMKQVRAMFEK